MSQPLRPRGPRTFTKPALGPADQLALLHDRGLGVPDPERARRYLRQIGYYRLSPYMIPFQDGTQAHRFVRDAVFDDVLDLYVFDRALRLQVIDALERAEVAVRAALTDHMAVEYGDSHWYADPQHFADSSKHAKLLADVRRTSDRQLRREAEPAEGILHPRSALEHYLTTYGAPELPPSWVMVESLTIGQLEVTYGNLKLRADRTAISRALGLPEPVLGSWLRTYVRVRNISAHYGRLWNVGLGVYPAIPKSSAVSWPRGPGAVTGQSTRRLYPVLVSLQSVLDTVSPRSGWARRLRDLLSSRPGMNLRGMGFPEAWTDDEFWSRRLE